MRSERNSLSFIFFDSCRKALSYMSKIFITYMEKLYDYCQKIRIQREIGLTHYKFPDLLKSIYL